MDAPSGFVVVWACFCTDADDDPAVLPELCPGHLRHRIGGLIENERPGGVTAGHICREDICMTTPDAHPVTTPPTDTPHTTSDRDNT